MIHPGLRDGVALITGANSGIGAAITRRLAAHGVRCVVHYLSENTAGPDGATPLHEVPGKAAADALVREIAEQGGHALAVAADLSDAGAPRRLLDAAESAFGGVDILVNNAAHCEAPDTILEVTAGTIDRHFAVNVRAAALLMREMITRLRRRNGSRGRIINISTDSARSFPTQIAYGASKYALESLTRSVAIEAGPFGVTVNCLAPGPVQTGWISAELGERVVPHIPLGRLGSPSDVADAVAFLASDHASWITGQVIQVAGGHAL